MDGKVWWQTTCLTSQLSAHTKSVCWALRALSAPITRMLYMKFECIMKRILLAGSTGYLGSYIAKELHKRPFFFRAIARSPDKLEKNGIKAAEILKAELTDPDSVKECCKDIDVVISTVGITRQKDGLTYMDVDYQANMNLLKEAKKSGVKKFIYVSVLNGEKLRNLKICDAKEMFVEQLKKSGIDYCIVRPNGFFSDMSEFYNMAKRGEYIFLEMES